VVEGRDQVYQARQSGRSSSIDSSRAQAGSAPPARLPMWQQLPAPFRDCGSDPGAAGTGPRAAATTASKPKGPRLPTPSNLLPSSQPRPAPPALQANSLKAGLLVALLISPQLPMIALASSLPHPLARRHWNRGDRSPRGEGLRRPPDRSAA